MAIFPWQGRLVKSQGPPRACWWWTRRPAARSCARTCPWARPGTPRSWARRAPRTPLRQTPARPRRPARHTPFPALDAGLLPSTRSLLKSRGTPSNASHASQRTWVCGRRKPGGRGQHAPPLTETHMRLSCRRHRRGQAARLRGGEAAAVGQRLAVHVRPDLLRGRHQERGHHHAPARAVQQPRRRLEVLRLAARARPGSAALGSASPDT